MGGKNAIHEFGHKYTNFGGIRVFVGYSWMAMSNVKIIFNRERALSTPNPDEEG